MKMLATELKPGNVSLMVGVSGAAGERLAEVTASRRSLPLRASARAGGRLTKQIGICPLTRSASAGVPPL